MYTLPVEAHQSFRSLTWHISVASDSQLTKIAWSVVFLFLASDSKQHFRNSSIFHLLSNLWRAFITAVLLFYGSHSPLTVYCWSSGIFPSATIKLHKPVSHLLSEKNNLTHYYCFNFFIVISTFKIIAPLVNLCDFSSRLLKIWYESTPS